MAILKTRSWQQLFMLVWTACSIAATVYFQFLQVPYLSKSKLLLTFIIFLGTAFLIYCLQQRMIGKFPSAQPSHQAHWAYLFSVFSSLVILAGFYDLLPDNQLLLPDHQLTICHEGQQNPAATASAVHIYDLQPQYGSTSLTAMQTTGQWHHDSDGLWLAKASTLPACAVWKGKTGSQFHLFMETGVNMGIITAQWDNGTKELIDLYRPAANKIEKFDYTFPIPFWNKATVFAAHSFSLAAIFYLILYLWLFAGSATPSTSRSNRNMHWLWYSLPMIAGWALVLLVLFPGLLSQDSITHWKQMATGDYNSLHSVLYTLCIWLLTRLWYSPAIVFIVQILALSLTFAWGLGILEKAGAPRWSLWMLSLLFTVFLPNALYVNTLWKDIPYSILILWLSISLTRLALQNSSRSISWLQSVSIGVALSALLLFRHNGLFVVMIVILLLFLIVWRDWQKPLVTACTFLLLTVLFNSPVSSALGVENYNKTSLIYFFHIAAHEAAGDGILLEEHEVLNTILPDAEQYYQCSTHNDIYEHPRLDHTQLSLADQQLRAITLRLFLHNPMVDFKHQICAGSLVWQVPPQTYTYLGPLNPNIGRWIVENNFGIAEDSKFPQMLPGIMKIIEFTQENPIAFRIFWRPALLLYLLLIVSGALLLRWKNWRTLIPAIPVLVHSFTLMAVELSHEYRFQYPLTLVALWSIGLIFITWRKGNNPETTP